MISLTLKTAANTLVQNNLVDVGNMKGGEVAPRFDKVLEEFYSICDQMELHLKTAAECLNQGNSSNRYLPLNVVTTRLEPLPGQDPSQLTYPQYLATVRAQVIYAKEIHDMLLAAAHNIQNPSTAE
ncbi:mediator of RNA polymerase II transcription subunit 29 [Nilaparvata lugens]|uniref:mediator of RNA polymerase II transcription subunit 29 n=1 Tax=Nilaparvata lugens TaxID=108931 RepID=UPI00193E1C18|nr:mediator of RNA polymerase II transcription subunit 29 [Nilaparvata lugens]